MQKAEFNICGCLPFWNWFNFLMTSKTMCYSSGCFWPPCSPAGVQEHCQALCPCSCPRGLWVYFWLDTGWWLAMKDDVCSCTGRGPPTSQHCVCVPELLVLWPFHLLPTFVADCGGSSGLLWSSTASLLFSLSVLHVLSISALHQPLWAAESQGTRAATELRRQLNVWCPRYSILPQPPSLSEPRQKQSRNPITPHVES